MRQPTTTRAVLSTALLSLLFASNVTIAEIYKWVDADGRVHFTDAPPADKASKVQLDVRKPPATPDAGEIRRRQLVERVQLEAKHSAEMKEKFANPGTEPDPLPQVSSSAPGCMRARHRWYALIQEMPVYWTESGTIRSFWHGDTYQGERSYISDKERPGIMDETMRSIEAYCPNGETDDAAGSEYAAWLRIEDCLVSQSRLELATQGSSRTTKGELATINAEVDEFCN